MPGTLVPGTGAYFKKKILPTKSAATFRCHRIPAPTHQTMYQTVSLHPKEFCRPVLNRGSNDEVFKKKYSLPGFDPGLEPLFNLSMEPIIKQRKKLHFKKMQCVYYQTKIGI
jgi:hypothetical protein